MPRGIPDHPGGIPDHPGGIPDHPGGIPDHPAAFPTAPPAPTRHPRPTLRYAGDPLLDALLRIAATPDGAWPLALARRELGAAFDAMLAEGVLRTETSWEHPCDDDHLDCPRRVQDDPDRVDLVRAVCGAVPPRCEPLVLLRADARIVKLIPEGLGAWLGRLVGVERPSKLPPGTRGAFAVGMMSTKLHVALTTGPADEVAELVAALAATNRSWLVLTTRPTVPGREGVATATLADVLRDDEGVVRASLPRPAPKPMLTDVRQAAPVVRGASSWEDVRISLHDGHTVLVRIGRGVQRLSYLDLGMANPRSREPSLQFSLLTALCKTGGVMSWKNEGASSTMKNRVSRLREDLRRAFGLGGDPFFPYEVGLGYRTRFVARVEGEAGVVTRRAVDEDDEEL